MVRVRVVTPVPRHSSHGFSMIDPLPRHSVHGSEKPKAPWLRLTTPEPLQLGHTFGLVPGRALEVREARELDGVLTVEDEDGVAHPLGSSLARSIFVLVPPA